MGATCGVDTGCCKGNVNTEEIVAVSSNYVNIDKEGQTIKQDGTPGLVRPRQDSVRSGGYNSTTFIQNNINVYSQAVLEEVTDLQLQDGSVYSGQVVQGTQIRHGKGTQVFPDGAQYVGEWMNNMVEGQGTFYHVNGDVFEGSFIADKANG